MRDFAQECTGQLGFLGAALLSSYRLNLLSCRLVVGRIRSPNIFSHLARQAADNGQDFSASLHR